MHRKGIVGLVWAITLTTVGVLLVIGVANRIPFTRGLVGMALYPTTAG